MSINIKMEKSLTPEEVYSIARPSIVAKLVDKPVPTRVIGSITETRKKLDNDRAKYDSNVYVIYRNNKQEIENKIKAMKTNDIFARQVSNFIGGYNSWAVDQVIGFANSIMNEDPGALFRVEKYLDTIQGTVTTDISKLNDKKINNDRKIQLIQDTYDKLAYEEANRKDDLRANIPASRDYDKTRNIVGSKFIANMDVRGLAIRMMLRENTLDNKARYKEIRSIITGLPASPNLTTTISKSVGPGSQYNLDAWRDNSINSLKNKNIVLDNDINAQNDELNSIIAYKAKLDEMNNTGTLEKELEESKQALKGIEGDIKKRVETIKQEVKTFETPNVRINKSNKILKEHLEQGVVNKCIFFENIRKYRTIGELMGNNDMLLIIYRTRENYGHWVGLFRNSYGINYFNSYGTYIDKARDNIPSDFKELTDQGFPHLLELLMEGVETVYWNDKPLQGRGGSTTCGRWVGYCMQRCAGLDGERMEDFIDSFEAVRDKNDPHSLDKVIVKLTDPYLKVKAPKVKWIGMD